MRKLRRALATVIGAVVILIPSMMGEGAQALGSSTDSISIPLLK